MHISTTGGAGLSSGLSHIQSNAPSSGLGRAGSGKVSVGGLGEVCFSEASGRGREGGCSLCDGQTVLHPETRSTRRMVSAHPVVASSEGGGALIPLQDVAAFVCITRVQMKEQVYLQLSELMSVS